MKTYKEIAEKKCLEIYDGDCESPREWSNLGYFITVEKDYLSPDNNERLYNIVKNSGEVANCQQDHIKLIKSNYNDTDDTIIAIYPVTKYEHGAVVYSLGTKHGFDYSNNGFYIITTETQKEMGTEDKDFIKVIKQELELYNSWCNGENYHYALYNDKGELIDSCGCFYDLEDIREYLPKEYKDEDLSDYLIE